MKKKCGGCRYWIKWNNDMYGGGLCDAKDARRSSDGKACIWFKRIPYNRLKQKILARISYNDPGVMRRPVNIILGDYDVR